MHLIFTLYFFNLKGNIVRGKKMSYFLFTKFHIIVICGDKKEKFLNEMIIIYKQEARICYI